MANRFWVTQPVSGAVVSVASPPQVRLTVSSTTGMTTGDTRVVFGVGGTTEANGTWVITVIDATHIDLQGTTFANLYTSGGSVNGRWDATNTNNWVTTSGGTNYGQTVPGTSDAVTLDGSSGGGTVTPNGPNSGAVTVQSITCGAFTGTLDFSANNNNVTLSAAAAFSGTGTGTRTINLGNGTWTLSSAAGASNIWDMTTTTNLTFNANSSVIALTGNVTGIQTRPFVGGGLTYATVQIGASVGGTTISGANTFGTLTITGPNAVTSSANLTITNLNLSGTSGNPVYFASSSLSTQRTLTITTLTATWAALRSLIGTGTATNSFDLGNNSGITITPPASGGISVDTVTAAIMDARVMTPY